MATKTAERHGRRASGPTTVPLIEGEELLIEERPAWSAWSRLLTLAGGLFLFGLLALMADGVATAMLWFVAVGIVAYVFFSRKRIRYVVTDRRIVKQVGLFGNYTYETWMEDIRGLSTGASFLEGVMGHGHISVSTNLLDHRGSFLNPLGVGMTLGGIPEQERIAGTIRRRQMERKGE